MKLKQILPFFIFVLPLSFLFLGITYHDSFYFVLVAISMIFSLFFSIPNLLPKKHFHLLALRFKFKKNLTINSESNEENKARFAYSHIEHKKRRLSFIKNPFLIFFLAYLIIFTLVSVFALPATDSKNVLTGYYFSYFNLIKTSPVFVLIPIILSTVVIYFFKKIAKEKFSLGSHPKSKAKVLISIFLVLFLSFNVSLASSFLFGLVDLNLLSVRVKSSPGSAGLIWGKDKVLQKLKGMDHSPAITEGGKEINASMIFLGSTNTNSRSKYYTQYIIKNIPSDLVMSPGVPSEPLVMFGDNLIINSLDKDQIETISPTLGKLLVKKYFVNRFIKDEPKIQVLGRQDYLKFREDQINGQLVKLDELISMAIDAINTIFGNITTDKQKIAYNQNGLNESIVSRYSSYNNCINAGYYFYGDFYHTFTQSYCDSLRAEWESIIATFQKNISDWEASLQADQAQLPQYQDALQSLEAYRALLASQKDSTPQELGIFSGKDNTIKIALDFTGSKSVTEYLETLTHEYLHYTSYVTQERSLLPFFEEGFTEYYARKVIKEDLGQDTNIGYPLLVKIIRQMVTKIPDNEIQDIYFNKDQHMLQSLLDEAYGKDFYKDSTYYFNVMALVPPKDALKIANNIMTKIGGKPLTESDLISSLPKVN